MRSLQPDEKRMSIQRNDVAMRINMRREVGFNRNVMRLLGNPLHVEFWWAEHSNVLLVGAAKELTDKSIVLPFSTYTRCGAPFVRNVKLRRALKVLIGMEDDAVAIFHGEYVPELDMVAFRIEDAVGIEVTANV
jgi:hypothetical protein